MKTTLEIRLELLEEARVGMHEPCDKCWPMIDAIVHRAAHREHMAYLQGGTDMAKGVIAKAGGEE